MPAVEGHVAGEPETENQYDQLLKEAWPPGPFLDHQGYPNMAAVMKGVGQPEKRGCGERPAGHVFRRGDDKTEQPTDDLGQNNDHDQSYAEASGVAGCQIKFLSKRVHNGCLPEQPPEYSGGFR